MKNIAVMVIAYDKYSDLWDSFFDCMDRYWSKKIPIYLVTNNKLPEYNGVTTIKTGDELSWSNKVRCALNKINEDYLIVLLEDYFLSDIVDDNGLEDLLNDFISNEMDYLRLVPIPFEYKNKKKGIYKLDEKFQYGVNLQASIWRKDYLRKLLYDDNFSAWEFEARQKHGSKVKIEGKCSTVNYFAINYIK